MYVSNEIRNYTTKNSVTCSNPKCNAGLIKLKFCKFDMYCKRTFCENSSQNMVNLTMFQDEILTLIPNAMNKNENDMKKDLMEDFDEK